MRFAVARRLRMPSALLSTLRWLGLRPALERARAGFAARPRCQSSISATAYGLGTVETWRYGRLYVGWRGNICRSRPD
jgi:hypothetical protein